MPSYTSDPGSTNSPHSMPSTARAARKAHLLCSPTIMPSYTSAPGSTNSTPRGSKPPRAYVVLLPPEQGRRGRGGWPVVEGEQPCAEKGGMASRPRLAGGPWCCYCNWCCCCNHAAHMLRQQQQPRCSSRQRSLTACHAVQRSTPPNVPPSHPSKAASSSLNTQLPPQSTPKAYSSFLPSFLGCIAAALAAPDTLMRAPLRTRSSPPRKAPYLRAGRGRAVGHSRATEQQGL